MERRRWNTSEFSLDSFFQHRAKTTLVRFVSFCLKVGYFFSFHLSWFLSSLASQRDNKAISVLLRPGGPWDGYVGRGGDRRDGEFRRSILSCIDADFYNQILILQRFSRSTRFSQFASLATQKSCKISSIFCEILQNFSEFCKVLLNFVKQVTARVPKRAPSTCPHIV